MRRQREKTHTRQKENNDFAIIHEVFNSPLTPVRSHIYSLLPPPSPPPFSMFASHTTSLPTLDLLLQGVFQSAVRCRPGWKTSQVQGGIVAIVTVVTVVVVVVTAAPLALATSSNALACGFSQKKQQQQQQDLIHGKMIKIEHHLDSLCIFISSTKTVSS